MTRRIARFFEIRSWIVLAGSTPLIAITLVQLLGAFVDLRVLFFLFPKMLLSLAVIVHGLTLIPAYRRIRIGKLSQRAETMVWLITAVIDIGLLIAAVAIFMVHPPRLPAYYAAIPLSLWMIALAALLIISIVLATYALSVTASGSAHIPAPTFWEFLFATTASWLGLLFSVALALEFDSLPIFLIIAIAGGELAGWSVDRFLHFLAAAPIPASPLMATAGILLGILISLPVFFTAFSALLPRFAREGNRTGIGVLRAFGGRIYGEGSPRTLTAIAARQGHIDLVGDLTGRTPATHHWPGRDAVEQLVRSRALVARNEEAMEVLFSPSAEAALFTAIDRELPEVVTLLLKSRTQPPPPGALRRAARTGYDRMVEALLAAGSSPDESDPATGKSALMVALQPQRGNAFAVVRLLLDAGASVNARSRDGSTALMIAQQQLPPAAAAEVTGLLLARGADVHLRDKDGRTALDFATGQAANWISAAGGRP